MKVKICGITNLEDALTAVDLGATALGFMFYPKSKRYVTPETATKIISSLPDEIKKVGVFVNQSKLEIENTVKKSGISWIQLHGTEDPSYLGCFSVPSFKVLHANSTEEIMKNAQIYQGSPYFLLDTPSADFGGTGRPFDWSIADQLIAERKVFLAGGIGEHNIAQIISNHMPFGVDLSSSVESSPGKKDKLKLKNFFTQFNKSLESR